MKPFLITLILTLMTLAVLGQQNAPVAGQAATLTDLLKKDYSSIDPDLRGDEIVKDRALVISIFRSFLQAKKYSTVYTRQTQLNTETGRAATKYSAYNQAKKLVASGQVNSISATNADAVGAINKIQKQNNKSSDSARNVYYLAQNKADDDQFGLLITNFTDDGNSFVTDVIKLFQAKYKALSTGTTDFMATVNANSAVQKALPFLGGSLDVSSTQIIDGISKFLAKRIKEELMTFAVQNIQKWINDNKKKTPVEELLVLLPAPHNIWRISIRKR